MAKYIDVDLLQKRIVEQMESLPREVERGAGTITSKSYGMMEAFQIVRSIIDSLQQEQPGVNLDAEIDKFLYGTKFKRDCDGIHVPGVCMRDWKGKKYINRDVTPDDMRKFACHFYELGLNARKEDTL